jgi:hypothetical protein
MGLLLALASAVAEEKHRAAAVAMVLRLWRQTNKRPEVRDSQHHESNCSAFQSGVLIPVAGGAAVFLPKLKSKPSVSESADERASASTSGLNNLVGCVSANAGHAGIDSASTLGFEHVNKT